MEWDEFKIKMAALLLAGQAFHMIEEDEDLLKRFAEHIGVPEDEIKALIQDAHDVLNPWCSDAQRRKAVQEFTNPN